MWSPKRNQLIRLPIGRTHRSASKNKYTIDRLHLVTTNWAEANLKINLLPCVLLHNQRSNFVKLFSFEFAPKVQYRTSEEKKQSIRRLVWAWRSSERSPICLVLMCMWRMVHNSDSVRTPSPESLHHSTSRLYLNVEYVLRIECISHMSNLSNRIELVNQQTHTHTRT